MGVYAMVRFDRALLIRTSKSGSPFAMRRRGRRSMCGPLQGTARSSSAPRLRYLDLGWRTHTPTTGFLRLEGGVWRAKGRSQRTEVEIMKVGGVDVTCLVLLFPPIVRFTLRSPVDRL